MKEVYGKVLAIQSEMTKLPKNGYNSFHKYAYVTEADAMEMFRDLCVKHGVVVIPTISIVAHNGDLTTINASYRIIDCDTGKEITCEIPGQGQDKGDKGIYKAITGSYKYFIMKTFMIPTGDDPERDEGVKPVQTKKAYTPTASSSSNPLWSSEFKGKMYLHAIPCKEFSEEELANAGLKQGKKSWYMEYDEDTYKHLEELLYNMKDTSDVPY